MNIHNNNFQKNSNISRVLQVLWSTELDTRAEISRHLELYRSTTSNIISYLINTNFVNETEERSALPQGGRKPIILEINKDYGCVLGIEVKPGIANISVINVLGETLFNQTKPFNHTNFTESLISILKELNKDLTIPPLALCIGLPGIVNPEEKIIFSSKPLSLINLNLSKFISKNFNIPVLIENDAKCLAWLQLTKNRKLQNHDYMVVMASKHNNGIGVGLAFTFENKLRYGKNFGAGEFFSNSWRIGMSGQTSITTDEQLNILNDDKIYKKWIKDVFETLTPTIAMLAPDCLFIHGQPNDRKDEILQFLKAKVPQFFEIANNASCEICFSPNDEYEIATGAASMFLQKLYTVPDITEIDSTLRFDWESLFELRNNKSIFKC